MAERLTPPWAAVVNGPTGAMPQDFWSKIGAIASAVVNTLVQFGQMIYKGLVALGAFLVNLAWLASPIFSRISLYPPNGVGTPRPPTTAPA